jgi:hypothetical protein
MLLAMLGVVLGPALVRGSPAATDSAVVAPAGVTPVDAPAAPTHSRRSVSPAAALGIGLAATAVPTMLAYGLTGKDTQAEDIALVVGVTAGIVAGPAIGLWSGGRGDLARTGLFARAVVGAMGLGAAGLASAAWDNGDQTGAASVALGLLSVVSVGMVTVSVLHDLAITPSATSQGKRLSAGLGIRPDGVVTLNVRF